MHNQRFFSYLSLFTFMMIILLTGNNFLLLFVGWEGSLICLIWLDFNKFENLKTKRLNKIHKGKNIYFINKP